jgi:2-polyprenyl-3-methyl-5-hydroxy-6-metoxy-1,4-benzoquinol methylase
MNDGEKRNTWDERFNTPDYVYGTDPNAFLVEVAARIPKGAVLCLGEGEGRNAVYLAGKGYDVTAVDSSSVGLEKARRLAGERGVKITTVHSDVGRFDIGREKWAGIVSIFLHLPHDTRAALHRRCVSGLRPGGALVLEAYSPKQLEYGTGGPKSLDLLVGLESVKQELEGLLLERAQERVREVREGRFHQGPGAVVQVLGIKPA